MKRIFIRFEANKMALFACFASKRISKFYMRNEFRPDANFCLKRIFEANILSQNRILPNQTYKSTVTAYCFCILYTVHCPLFAANCPLFTANCLLSSAHCYCPQFTVHCSLLTVHCLLPTVHYPLFLLSTVY
jgi:hypothetical protein